MWYNASVTEEADHGRALRLSQTPMTGRMSDGPCHVRAGAAPPLDLQAALWQRLPRAGRRATYPPRGLRSGSDRRTPPHRLDGVSSWRRRAGRAGAPGPRGVASVTRRVVSRPPRRPPGDEAWGARRRSRDRAQDPGVHVDAARSTAVPATPRGALARVAQAAQRLAACRQRRTRAAGVAAEAGRPGTGGPPPHPRSFLATGGLVRATERGQTLAPCAPLPADASGQGTARA